MKKKNEKPKNETKDIQKDTGMDNYQHLHNDTNSNYKTFHLTILKQMTPEKLYETFLKSGNKQKLTIMTDTQLRKKLLKAKEQRQ